jgi:curved DNA-binding protein CbpA
VTAADEPDFYAVLGIPADATRAEIVRAFRRRALTHHPDRGGDTEAFQDAHRAYETLSDPVRRKAYDRRRAAPPRSAPRSLRRTAAAGSRPLRVGLRRRPPHGWPLGPRP